MNEKEIAEIRRHYRYDRSNITRICGCQVNTNGEIVSDFDQSIGLMSEEDANGMLGLLKKALSGHLGRNLLEIDFTTHQVDTSDNYALISNLKTSKLKDEELRTTLYAKIIENFAIDSSYLIILGYDEFDVFDASTDAMESRESSSVHSYMICAICPIKEGKVQMSYYSPGKCFRSVTSDTVVSRPEIGFVFPVIEDKQTNIYKALYYTKNLENNYSELVSALFDKEAPMPAKVQTETFGDILEEAVGEECSLRVVSSIHAQINEIIEESKNVDADAEMPCVTKKDAGDMLRFCGVSEEKVEAFEQSFDENFGQNAELPPENLSRAKQMQIETPEVSVKVNPGYTSFVETRVIDGVKYILIRADSSVMVNGVNVNI